MVTVYRLVPEGQKFDLDIDLLKVALPPEIELDAREDGLYAIVASEDEEDIQTQWLINRELDRIFFLTCVHLRAEMCRKSVSATVEIRHRIHARIPENIRPQLWTDQLALQLRIWSYAVDATDPNVKILLYFQIIELAYPDTKCPTDYPPYKDALRAPHPRTEAKLLRHLVAHAGDAKSETGKYLEYLSLPLRLSNVVHPLWSQAVIDRVVHVESQAREILQSALQHTAAGDATSRRT